jgi:hypothetical protein
MQIVVKGDLLEAWLARAAELKALVHPEHPAFVSRCRRCRAFRDALFKAN